ncbi:uncharacterized protein PAC_17049 [Phialocephala subalpina]|uniref:DJ-1/PfpI domain-containing protein n=1 Tax=Phialocephala subalpina TaxID=576137 RepID=A0A1L7XQ37_9HELO|nr:uncharacterized protein PAC_17049 [Phialocephala subalpina]
MAATGSNPIIKVLITLYPGMDAMDVVGPLGVLSYARHDIDDAKTKAFQIALAAKENDAEEDDDAVPTQGAVSAQGTFVGAHMTYVEAYECLEEFDILIVPGGGNTDDMVDMFDKSEPPEPLGLIKRYADIQAKDPKKERTLFAVSTGSLFLAHLGLLNGLSATTHPYEFTKFEKICSASAQRELADRCDVMEERYVVNNLRYDLGNLDENPYVRRKADVAARRPSMQQRKGSNAWKESNTRRESIIRRSEIRLGGLRVITTGGMTCGFDASLYLVAIMVSDEASAEVGRFMQYEWKKGIVIDGIDI